jgi:hypothetical protein
MKCAERSRTNLKAYKHKKEEIPKKRQYLKMHLNTAKIWASLGTKINPRKSHQIALNLNRKNFSKNY